MAIKHSITLSTTEPNNEVGVIKIRQADEQTQTLDVQITENGVPKSYQGLTVYFCAKLGQSSGLGVIEQKLKTQEMTNPTNGKLEYTIRAEDWQILGRQKGYFSFRKMKNDHEFVEQFTTRDFTFDVIKSVYSDGLKEVKKDGSTYVWTIEELIRLFNEYMASGKTDWEEFVEQNREILESVDPGGKLIGELIDARKPFGEEPFPNLGKRLDDQFGLNSDFREFEVEESFMRRTKNEFLERYANIRWFGADITGQSNINNAKSAAESLSDTIFFPKGVYKTNKFQSVAGKKYVGEKGTKIKIDYVEGESTVTWGLSTGCEYEKIHFYSSSENLEWNRGDLTNKTDIKIIDCRIEGFRHDSTMPNAWGLYLENSKRIRIKSTHFSDNTQADIAIVDGCEDIVLDSLTSDGNLHINFEPNSSINKIKNVTIKNTKIAKLSLLNNSLTYDGTEKILIENCEIDLVVYRGLDVEFVNCKINQMIGGKVGKNGFAANLKLNGAISLSDNLIVDPTLDSYSSADPLSDWLVAYSTKPVRDVTARSLNLLKIEGTSTGEQVQLKPKVIQENGDKSKYEIPVTANESYLFTFVGKAQYPIGASWISLLGRIVFLDVDDVELTTSNIEVSMFRSVGGTNTNIKEQSIVITPPLNAKKMSLRIGVGFGGATSTSNVWFGYVALQKILSGNGSFNQNYQLKSTREKNILYLPEAPSAAKGWGHYQKNDLCYNSNPQSDNPVGWICTETGYPGTWKSMGNLV